MATIWDMRNSLNSWLIEWNTRTWLSSSCLGVVALVIKRIDLSKGRKTSHKQLFQSSVERKEEWVKRL
jgi:hypothetical protein